MKKSLDLNDYSSFHMKLRIPFDDLIQKLKQLEAGGQNVTAKNKGFDFENVNDIRANPETFKGKPKIKVNSVSIGFDDDMTHIFLSRRSRNEGDWEIAENLSHFFKEYESELLSWFVKDPVSYRAKDSFWDRNGEKIISGIIGSVFTALLGLAIYYLKIQ